MSHKYHVGSEGPRTARLAVIAEKPAWDEVQANRPLIGYAGDALREHLEACRLDVGLKIWNEDRHRFERLQSGEVYLTNAVQNFDDPRANPTLEDVFREQPRLYQELSSLPNLNCIIALGNFGLASLGNMAYSNIDKKTKAPTGIGKWRGSVIPSKITRPDGSQIKMVPTYHTAFYQKDNWEFKPVVQFDINRAVEQSAFPEIHHTEREYCIEPTFDEAMSWFDEIERDLDAGIYDHRLKNGKVIRGLAWDIEAARGAYNSRYVSCFSMSITPTRGYCWPIIHHNRLSWWHPMEEAEIWSRKQRLFKREDITLITQNGPAFDYWVERQFGIIVPPSVLGRSFDSMHGHSFLAADLPHDLGFLTSVYSDEEYYKDESGDWDTKAEVYVKVPEPAFFSYSCKDA